MVFRLIMISGSSDRAIVDLQGDYEELDQNECGKPHAKAAFRVNQPQDLVLHWHALSGSQWPVVNPGGVYLDLPQMLRPRRWKKTKR